MDKLNNPIIVIDSGIGAVNIAQKLHEKLKNENIISISDTLYMPYGNLDLRKIKNRINKLIKYIEDNYNPKLIVIGCNTIDSICGDLLVNAFGNKVISIIKSASQDAINVSKTKNIGLFGTINTIESQKYMYQLIQLGNNINLLGVGCDNLAQLIEKKDFKNKLIDEEISVLQNEKIDTIILGCTHYSLIINKFKKYYEKQHIIDSSEAIVEQTIKKVNKINDYKTSHKEGSLKIFATKLTEEFLNNSHKITNNQEIEINEIKF